MEAIVEVDKNRIIITAVSPADVYVALDRIMARVGQAYFDFTTPVRDASGRYCSIGHVHSQPA